MALFMRLGLLLLAVSLAHAQGVPPVDSTPSSEQLASLAPMIDTRQTFLRSFEFTARFRGFFEATMRCYFEAPTSRACVVTHDGIPVFVAAGDRILTYNSLDGVLQWQAGWAVSIGIRPDGQFEWNYWFHDAGNPNARIEMNLAGLVERASKERTAVPRGGGQFVLQGFSEKGSRLEAWVQPERTVPYSRMQITDREGQMFLDVERLVGNDPVAPTMFQFPRVEEQMAVSPPVRVTMENMGWVLSRGLVDMMLRAGMKDAGMRPELETKIGRPVDWTALPQRDATEGQKLRTLIERHFGRVP